jgi:hypothetical protein
MIGIVGPEGLGVAAGVGAGVLEDEAAAGGDGAGVDEGAGASEDGSGALEDGSGAMGALD